MANLPPEIIKLAQQKLIQALDEKIIEMRHRPDELLKAMKQERDRVVKLFEK